MKVKQYLGEVVKLTNNEILEVISSHCNYEICEEYGFKIVEELKCDLFEGDDDCEDCENRFLKSEIVSNRVEKKVVG